MQILIGGIILCVILIAIIIISIFMIVEGIHHNDIFIPVFFGSIIIFCFYIMLSSPMKEDILNAKQISPTSIIKTNNWVIINYMENDKHLYSQSTYNNHLLNTSTNIILKIIPKYTILNQLFKHNKFEIETK